MNQHHESEWRATKQRPHQAPKAQRKSFNLKQFVLAAIILLGMAALYSTLPSECRGFQSSTFKYCVD